MAPSTRLESKVHSCSELEKGHKKLLAVKREGNDPDEFDAKIKEYEAQVKALKEKQKKAAEEETQPATEEELHERFPSRGRACKSKAAPPSKDPKGDKKKDVGKKSNGAQKDSDGPSVALKAVPKPKEKNTKAAEEAPEPSQPSKRLRKPPAEAAAKKGSPDPAAVLDEEKAKLRAELEVLQKKLEAAEKKKPTSSRASSTFTPPGRKVSGPSPATASGKRRRGADEAEEAEEPEVTGNDGDEDEPNTEAAKNNRLRRICEVKPSGRCHVSEEIHQRWKKGRTDRLALRDELEACGWDKDRFVSTMTKQREKMNKTVRTKKRGWYTKEKMKVKLGWSKSYIAGVVKFCERKGNESLVKKDKYNSDINKYHVEIDEEDESVDEDLERYVKTSTKAANAPVKFKKLNPKRTREDLVPAEGSEPEEDENSPQDAEPVTGIQEYASLKKFGDSLLSKTTKLSDLSGQLDEAILEHDQDSPHRERVKKSQKSLEAAMEILEREFEAVEKTKVEVEKLKGGKLDDAKAAPLIAKMEDQIQKTQQACAKVTTAEATAKNVLKMLTK